MKFAIATHGWSGPSKPVMELGTQGHAALETGKLEFNFDKTISREDQELIRAALNAVVPAYATYYKKENKSLSRIPEHVFNVPFAGTRLRGKIDDIVSGSGRKGEWIFETKFKSRIDEDSLERRLSMDWQLLFYAVARWIEVGVMPSGAIYNAVRYPKLSGKPKALYEKTVADIIDRPEFWFKRWEVSFEKKDLQSFRAELESKVQEATVRGSWYKNQCACVAGFGLCQYIGVCTNNNFDGLIQKKLFSELDS